MSPFGGEVGIGEANHEVVYDVAEAQTSIAYRLHPFSNHNKDTMNIYYTLPQFTWTV
jgi:hypothetical protein